MTKGLVSAQESAKSAVDDPGSELESSEGYQKAVQAIWKVRMFDHGTIGTVAGDINIVMPDESYNETMCSNYLGINPEDSKAEPVIFFYTGSVLGQSAYQELVQNELFSRPPSAPGSAPAPAPEHTLAEPASAEPQLAGVEDEKRSKSEDPDDLMSLLTVPVPVPANLPQERSSLDAEVLKGLLTQGVTARPSTPPNQNQSAAAVAAPPVALQLSSS